MRRVEQIQAVAVALVIALPSFFTPLEARTSSPVSPLPISKPDLLTAPPPAYPPTLLLHQEIKSVITRHYERGLLSPEVAVADEAEKKEAEGVVLPAALQGVLDGVLEFGSAFRERRERGGRQRLGGRETECENHAP